MPAGHYFAMGDNRDNSQDSRYWGFLPSHYVKGRALMIYWSFESGERRAGGSGLFGGTRWSRLSATRFTEPARSRAGTGERRAARLRTAGRLLIHSLIEALPEAYSTMATFLKLASSRRWC